MRSKFTWILTLFFALIVQAGFAQKPVTGVVKTQDGEPIPGATVMLVGTNQGTDTDEEGKYTLNLKKGDKIQVVYEGFKPTTVTATDSGVLNVTLVEDESIYLEDIVVDTYRTVSKPKSNVAASTVTSKTIEGRPNASFIQTLQGQVPGLNISTGSGQPGASNTTVLLRGIGSINGNTEPLYVIDGMPMSSANFRSINPNDIDNVTVLKDAGATSIYGNRGANGVIVVKTKNASFDQKLQIKYVGTVGLSTMQNHKYNLMNSQELMRFENASGLMSQNWSESAIKNAVTTDWLNDVVFRKAMSQSHTLSISSGNKNLNQFTSIGYTDQEGILKTTDLKRFTFRNNLSGKSSDDRLTFGTNLNVNFSRSNQATSLGTGGVNQNYVLGGLQGVPYYNPAAYSPTGRVIVKDDGTQGLPTDGAVGSILDVYTARRDNQNFLKLTPLLIMDKMNWFTNYQDEVKAIGNANINYDLGEGFTVGTSLGVDYQQISQTRGDSPYSFNEWYFAQGLSQRYLGWESDINERIVSFNSTTNLKWSKIFNKKHELKLGAYLEYLKAHFKSSSLVQTGVQEYFYKAGSGAGWIGDNSTDDLYMPSISLSTAQSGLFSYFGTADYDYDSKYGVGLTLRRDASFRFSQENRWGTFWSASARWNINNEEFMNESVFDELKLRGSYGTAGNQDILGTGLFGASSLYKEVYSLSGLSYNDQTTTYLSNLPNPNLQWETIEQANIGVDFGVWNSRLRGTVDVYQKTTKDLYQTRPVSAIHGSSGIQDNIGSMRNSGVEVILAGDIIRKENLKITLNANGSVNKNEFIELAGDNGTGVVWNGGLTTMREGDPYGQFYLVKYAGVNPDNGNLLFYNKDGEKVEYYTNDDRQFTGKSFIPKYQGGFGLDIDYKGWFLSSNFTFVADVWRFDYDYQGFLDAGSIGTFNMSVDALDYWTENNRNASLPSLTAENTSWQSYSDRNLRDGSYVRLRYLSVGYNFKKKDLDFMKLTGLRVFAQGENIYTWTKWKGFDAESNRGNDQAQYPTPRTISFGVEVQF